MPNSIRPGDVLADRYRLVDLLTESGGGRFWRAHDRVLERHVAAARDRRRRRAGRGAARGGPAVGHRARPRDLLRVLDADQRRRRLLRRQRVGLGQLARHHARRTRARSAPRRAAWLVSEVAPRSRPPTTPGVAHGRLIPENVLVDQTGSVRVIGFAVDAALHGLPPGRISTDVADLAGLLYCALTGKWPGVSRSAVPPRPARARPGAASPPGARRRPPAAGRAVRRGAQPVRRPRRAHDRARPRPRHRPRHRRLPARLRRRPDRAWRRPRPGTRPPTGGTDDRSCCRRCPRSRLPAETPPDAAAPSPSRPCRPEPAEPSSRRARRRPRAAAPPAEQPTQAGMPIFDDEQRRRVLAARAGRAAAAAAAVRGAAGAAAVRARARAGRPARARQARPQAPATAAGRRVLAVGRQQHGPRHAAPASPRCRRGRRGRRRSRAAAGCGWPPAIGAAWSCCSRSSSRSTSAAAAPRWAPSPSRAADRRPPRPPRPTAPTPLTGLIATRLRPAGRPAGGEPRARAARRRRRPGDRLAHRHLRPELRPGGLKTGVGLVLDLGAVQRGRRGRPRPGRRAHRRLALRHRPRRPPPSPGSTPASPRSTRRPASAASPSTSRPPGATSSSGSPRCPPADGGFRGEVAEVVVRG